MFVMCYYYDKKKENKKKSFKNSTLIHVSRTVGIKHVKQLKFKQGKDYNRFKAEYRRASDLCKLVFFCTPCLS